MVNNFLIQSLSKEYILSKISQEDIFEKYLGIQVSYNKLQKANHRKDPKPSVSFKIQGSGDIICRDFGDPRIKGDCFSVVSGLFSCSYNDSLKIIANDFNILGINSKKLTINKRYKPEVLKDPEERDIIPIKIKKRGWDNKDIRYWLNYGISIKTLLYFNVTPISHYWYNDDIRICKPTTFAYYFKSYCYKIYSPLEKLYRFINNSNEIQGWNQLPSDGDLLVITKSLKDVMVFYEFGINAIAPQSEAITITQKQYNNLSKRFKKIVVVYDFDYQGLVGSGKMKRRFGIKRIMLTDGRYGTKSITKHKDISDFSKAEGKEGTEKLLKYLKLWI